jgi:hypothetical protein
VDGDVVAAIEPAGVVQLASQKVCHIFGVGGIGGAFKNH